MEFFDGFKKRVTLAHSHKTQQNTSEPNLEVPTEQSEERCGLFILSNETAGRAKAIDIIAVHGLGGHWQATWMDESGKLWLRDFLPQQLKESAINVRIMTYGYNSDTIFSKAVTDIEDEAGMLLDRINGERQSDLEKQRSIVFISHSLGGIIVKKAMIRAHERSSEYGELLSCIRGSVFFGVPHRGADAAYWATFAATLLRFGQLGFRTNTAYVSALQRNSRTFADISRQFVERAVQLKIRTFFETERMSGQLIVDKDSAILGLPNEIAIGIAGATHRTMCKFSGAESQKYKPVWVAIKVMVESILDGESSSQSPFSEQEAKCVQLLYKSDYNFQRERIPPRAPGTCEWIIQHENYRTWRQESEPSILWISGPPGCGKSTLASFVEDELSNSESQQDVGIVCHFFFKDDNEDEKSADSALCTLLHQLFTAKPFLVKYAIADYQNKTDRFTKEPSTLWKIFTAACMDKRCGNVWCILDGLDQCEEKTRNQLTKSLASFFSGHPRLPEGSTVKFLLTSRPYTSIERELDVVPLFRIQAEEETLAIESDVTRVIKHRLENISRMKHISETLRADIEKRLVDTADRTFIWVALVLDLIETSDRSSRAALEDLISSIPPKLEALYEKILYSYSWNMHARKVLHIVLVSTRPLSLQEMNVAFSINENDTSEDDLDLEPAIDITIRGICGPLVRTVASRVILVHETAKEFLLKEVHGSSTVTDTWKHSFDMVESHAILANICIRYLMLDDFDTSPFHTRGPLHVEASNIVESDTPKVGILKTIDWNLLDTIESYCAKHVFLGYASKNWAKHFSAGKEDPMLLEFALALCNVNSERYTTWETVFFGITSVFSICPLPTDLTAAAFFGIKSVVQRLLETGSDVSTVGLFGTALDAASIYGREDIIKILVEHGARVNPDMKGRRSAIASASYTGHVGLVRLLLQYGAELDNDTLTSAALGGHEAIILLLLENGADVNAPDTNNNTALQLAASGGHGRIVQLLILKGAEVNNLGGHFGGPLHAAAYGGHEPVVRLLLNSGANVNAQYGVYDTALQAAACGGNSAVVQLLINNGAEVNLLGGLYGSALHGAACRGHTAEMELLLKNGADINASSREFGTPLQMACFAGHEKVVQLLLANGADVTAQGGMYGNALQVAVSRNHEKIAGILLGLEMDVNGTGAVYFADGEAELTINVFRNRAGDLGYLAEDSKARGAALHLAAAHGNEALVQRLIQSGANVAALDSDEGTALHIAAALGYEGVVEELIKSGADITTENGTGVTALHLAAMEGQVQVVRQLLSNGADIEATNQTGATALLVAAVKEQEEVVQQLLESGANIAATDETGTTALHVAAFIGHEAMARRLLENGADITAIDVVGATALHAAALTGCNSVVRVLLESGASIAAVNQDGLTALHVAATEGQEEVVEQLLENGADITATNRIGATALHIAAVKGREEVLQLLLDNGADIAAIDNTRSTALHVAPFAGNAAIVRKLLEHGADVAATDIVGATALHAAALTGCNSAVQALLESGASIAAVNHAEMTALHVAAMKGYEEVVRQLLENGADIAAIEKNGLTALHLAAKEGQEEVVRQLLEHGADIVAIDEIGSTALHLAAMAGQENVSQLLLQKGANVIVRDEDGFSPLHLAAMEGQEGVVQQLLEHGADIAAIDKTGSTALHLAATEGQEEVVQQLLENGADTAATDETGLTAVHLAAMGGHEGVLKLLLEKVANVTVEEGELSAFVLAVMEEQRQLPQS